MSSRPMRRANREVRDAGELRAIFERAGVVRVGSHDVEGLFITPMSFGFDWESDAAAPTLWLHSAREGRKADAWTADAEVALELDVPAGVIGGDFACAYSLAYESVMAVGRVSLVSDPVEKLHGLERLMAHMAPGAPTRFSPEAVEGVAVWRIDVERLTGKRREGMPVAAGAPAGSDAKDKKPKKKASKKDKKGKKPDKEKKPGEKPDKAKKGTDGKASVPSKKQVKALLAKEHCPGCGHHCKLTSPHCGKGRKVREHRLEKLGVRA